MRRNGPRRQRVDERMAAPWPEQTRQQRDAEALAVHFGLGYLSSEGFAKLAQLLVWVDPLRWSPPESPSPPADIVTQPLERIG